MDVSIESFGDRKVFYVIVFLQEHLVVDLAYSQGEHGQHNKEEISACTQGEHNPLPLMTKGENDLGSWCCHQVQRGRLLALWHRFGAMAQVLSLMATIFGNRSQF